MLYERDYRILTEEEKKIYAKVESAFEKARNKNSGISIKALDSYYNKLPIAALHYQQLFPNNYLSTNSLFDKLQLETTANEFKDLLNNSASEREILNFINTRKAFYIIASIFKGYHYDFGHHKAFAFKEFELPANYIVDYLLVGKNSGGYEFIFVELESPSGQITKKDGGFGATIKKGIKQVTDWDIWFEANYSSLRLVYDKYLGNTEELPREFHELDKSRIHYVVIAGRRTDFNKKTYQLKRRLLKQNNILLLHYDNLLDSTSFLLKTRNY